MRPRDEGSCSDRNVGWRTFGISANTPAYLTAVFDSDGTVWKWFPELVWTFLRGTKYVPCTGLILNNSPSASHLIENECNSGRQWHEGLGWRFICYRSPYPRTGTHLDGTTCTTWSSGCVFGRSPAARLAIGASSWIEWQRRRSTPVLCSTLYQHSIPLENVKAWLSINHRPQYSITLFRVLTVALQWQKFDSSHIKPRCSRSYVYENSKGDESSVRWQFIASLSPRRLQWLPAPSLVLLPLPVRK